MRRRVRLPASVLAQVREHAREALPAEACGALVGVSGADGAVLHVARALRLENEEQGATRYRISAGAVRAAGAEAAAAGLEVLGFYHSHPGSAHTPSALDLDAAWPTYAYLIVDPHTGGARAWRLAEDRSAMLEDDLEEVEGA